MGRLKTVAIGTRLQTGPFGGGNQFAQALTAYLSERGVMVVSDLTRPDIDVILITSVKPWARGAAFDITEAIRYRALHPATKIVLRVNECDERKGYRWPLLNNLIRLSSQYVDHTVFVSHWLQDTLLATKNISVIRSGADPTIFNSNGGAKWDGRGPLKIVTHHWSSSWYKGWDVYQTLDDFLGTPEGKQFEFTFIGNVWPTAWLKHTKVLPATSGAELARLLKENHAYISASQHEPAGMHYIEAVQCGLPILWRQSGSLPEYCSNYGVGFTGPEDVVTALATLRREYVRWANATARLTYTADDMCQAYVALFESLVATPQVHSNRSTAALRLQQGLLWLRDTLV